jgi:redox-regulated HSP33 family molecular chaperone
MENKISSQSAFFNLRIAIVVLAALLGLFLVRFGAISKDSVGATGPLQAAAATANAQGAIKEVANNPHRYLDEKGNRASGIEP